MSYDCDNIGCPNQAAHPDQLCAACQEEEDELNDVEDDDDYDY